jgi:hypothetical protein
MGSASCVKLRPSEKYQGVPPVPRNDGWKSVNGIAGKVCLSGFRSLPLARIRASADKPKTLG